MLSWQQIDVLLYIQLYLSLALSGLRTACICVTCVNCKPVHYNHRGHHDTVGL